MFDFGNSLPKATPLQKVTATPTHAIVQNSLSRHDRFDFLRLRLSQRSFLSASLSSANHKSSLKADLTLLDCSGKIVRQAHPSHKSGESFSATLKPGEYFLKVHGKGKSTRYSLHLSQSSSPIATSTISSLPAVLSPIASPQPKTSRLAAASPPSTKKAWTVMVYMAGNNLESFALNDFLEMASVGSTQDVNVVVQLDRTAQYAGTAADDTRFGDWSDTRRGLVQAGDQPSSLWGESVGEQDMGNPQTLQDFVDWSVNHYTADHYALVLWGHGDGQTVAFDDISHDGIRASELSTVLSQMPQKLDVLGADSCFMGNVEFAYQIQDHASVLVASQEDELGTGWTYDTLLQDLTANPAMDAIDFGKTIVRRYGEYYSTVSATNSLTLSAVELSSLGSISQPDRLIGSLNLFANTLKHTAASSLTQIDRIRDRYDMQGKPDGYCDLLNLCTSIASHSSLPARVRNAATNVLNALGTINGWYYSSTFDAQTGLDTHNGLSTYFADRHTTPQPNDRDQTLKFAQDTQWDDLLNSDLWR